MQRRSFEWPRDAEEKRNKDWHSDGVALICDDGTGNAKAKISNEMKCGGLALTCAAVELSRCD